MKKVSALLVALLIAVMMFAACGGKDDSTSAPAASTPAASTAESTPAAEGEPVYIGMVGPLTGALAFSGVQVNNAAKLACEQRATVLDRPIEFVSGDAQDAATSVSEFERLYEMGCRLFIGTYGSYADYAIQALVDDADAMLMSASGWANDWTEKGYKNYFHWTPRVEVFGEKMADEYLYSYAEMAGIKKEDIRVALFYSMNYEYVAESVRRNCEENGINIVVDEGYAADRQDFTPLIASFQSNDVNVLIPCQGSQDGPSFVKKMAEMGYTAPLQFAMGLFYDQTDFQALGADLTDGWMALSYTHTYINPDAAPGVAEFRDEFNKQFGNVPLTHATQTYACVLFLIDMIEKAGTDEVYAVIDEIRAADIEKGVYPNYWGVKFNENGVNTRAGDPLAIGQWQNNELVVVGTPDIAVAEPILPWDASKLAA